MERISAKDSARLGQLEVRFGSRRLRTLLGSEEHPIMRRQRFSNLLAGKGRISEAERERLQIVSANATKIEALGKRRQADKSVWKTNRAMRDWISYGKDKGTNYPSQDSFRKHQQRKAIKGLRYFGIEPEDGTFYVTMVKGK